MQETDNQCWPVVRYDGARARKPQAERWDWQELIRVLCWVRTWQRAKIDVPAWAPVQMQPGTTRAAKNVHSVSMLVLDCDRGESIEVLEALGDEYARLGHTSWSHSQQHPKARLIFPFATPCPAEHWPKVWGAAARWAAAHGVTVDQSAKDPSRLYFLPYVPWQPGHPAGNVHREQFESWFYSVDGQRDSYAGMPSRPRTLLSWAELASEYPAPPEPPAVRIATAGRANEQMDDHQKRRRVFALAMLRHRCRAMIAAGEGGKGAGTGRNNRTFALGRLVARLALAGAIDEAEGIAIVDQAATDAGLQARERSRAIRNGIAAGIADGAEDLDAHLTEGR
jgi:hypothetical protein